MLFTQCGVPSAKSCAIHSLIELLPVLIWLVVSLDHRLNSGCTSPFVGIKDKLLLFPRYTVAFGNYRQFVYMKNLTGETLVLNK